MPGRSNPGRKWEQTLEDLGTKTEAEVQRVIRYLNDEVIPDVRRDGSRALRSAAEELLKLAQRMEGRHPPVDPQAASQS